MADEILFLGRATPHDGARLYEQAVEQIQQSTFQRAVRPLRSLWGNVDGAVGDLVGLCMRLLSNAGVVGTLLKEEVTSLFWEIHNLPWVTRDMWRNGDFSRPFEHWSHLTTLYFRITHDFLCNWKISMRNLRLAYNSSWSASCKVYLTSVVLLSMFTVYHQKIRPWPRHNTKTELSCLHRTVVITGASCGLGYRLAFEFARRGAFVIITSPELVKARKARLDLARKLTRHIERERKMFLNNAKVRYYQQLEMPYQLDDYFILQNIVEMELNLGSTASIYSFTRKLQGMSPDGIDILVNNAAVNYPADEMVVTDEGKEAHFAVNYFGHFVLTNLLIAELTKRKGARVINVTCKKAAESIFLNLDQFIQPYLEEEGLPYLPAVEGYASSKLAMYLFNRQLAKELQISDIRNVTTYCVCPGTVKTFLFRDVRLPVVTKWWTSIKEVFQKKDWHAAQTILHCALSPRCSYESGFFYENNRRCLLDVRNDHPDLVAEELWEATLRLMGIGHQSMLKLTEQMLLTSDENVFQLANNLFLHRRDVMTHLLLMEEKRAFNRRHKREEHVEGGGDDHQPWHGFYLSGGDGSSLIERWLLYNAHPGFRELQKEYDIWFECTRATHFHPKSYGTLAPLQYMASMVRPIDQCDIPQLEMLHESDSEPDMEIEERPHLHPDYIRMEEFIDEDY